MYLNCKGVLQVGDYNWKSQGFYNIQLLKHTLGLNLENCLEDKWCYILKWRIFFFFFFCPLWKSHLVVGFLGKVQIQGTVKSLSKEDLVFPIKEKGKGSSSSSSPFFRTLEVDWDTTTSSEAMKELKQVGLFVFQCVSTKLWLV